MKRVSLVVALLSALLAWTDPVFAQGGTTSTLSGVVVDNSGGVIPGADVVAKHNATNVTTTAVSNAEGLFSFPGLPIGTYSVTVSLQGFKTYIANNVVLTSGAGANVHVTLEVGGLEEQVTVISSSEILQTQTSHISTTINSNQIIKLPLTTRAALDFVAMMPGVTSSAGNRDSTINGLPRGTINITLDGVNVQDNTLRSTDGFFAIVNPRLDAMEEVTVTTAAQGADAGGQGAVQVKFVTRSGGNTFTGSAYHYYRNDKLNANTWFNNRNGVAKAKLLQNQGGFRAGGPIVIPKVVDGHNKAFFFVNYEESRQPSDTTRNRTVLNTDAQLGIFRYPGTGGAIQSVNLLQLAAANGQLASTDPVITKMLSDIRAATGKTGSLAVIDSNLERYSYNVPVESLRRYPTFKIDYNVSNSHRLSSAFNYQYFTDLPDTLNNRDAAFPEFPVEASQSSKRLSWSNSLRSTLSNSMINEARVGYSWAPVTFFGELSTDMYTGPIANQAGFHVNFPTINTALTAAGNGAPAPQSRNATALVIEDGITWLRGAHSIATGLSFTEYGYWAKNSNLVPRITTGLIASDPANAMFTAANFPGASATNITAAQQLYAFLTGRVSTITGDGRLDESGQYVYMGTGLQQARMRETDLYIQDAWRVKPNLTINAGLRYGLQFPFYPTNSSYTTPTIADVCGVSGPAGDNACNVFSPGAKTNVKPLFYQFESGTHAYDIDLNNFAPSVGFAWTPAVPGGLLGKLMGHENEFVLRGGYTRAYSRPGMNDFTGFYNANPGVTIPVNRSDAQGNLTVAGVPLLFRNTASLTPAPFNPKPVYPLSDIVTEDTNMFDPHIQVPSADSWQVGMQRSLGRNNSIELRYVGSRGHGEWGTINYNEINIKENGFVDEFRKAQANLAANIAAGRGATFAYTGAAGTSPLPTLLGFYNGQGAARAGDPAAYTGTNWTNATFQAFLAARAPNPIGMVRNTSNSGLMDSATFRANALAAGIPSNFFMANPDLLNGANIRTNLQDSKYNSLQTVFNRRFSGGFSAQASYVFGKGYLTQFETVRQDPVFYRDVSTFQTPAGDVTHAFKLNAVYEPTWGAGSGGAMERLKHGWSFGVATRVQSGRLLDIGNVRLVGMTQNDVQDMFKLRFDDAGRKVWMLPQDVIDNTIAAFNVSATSPTGYSGTVPSGRYFAPANGPDCIELDNGSDLGACGVRSLVVTGPMFRQTDIRVSKRTKLVGSTNFEIGFEMLNAFNQANFVPVTGFANPNTTNSLNNNGFFNSSGAAINNYEVTALTGTNTARVMQIVTRFNW